MMTQVIRHQGCTITFVQLTLTPHAYIESEFRAGRLRGPFLAHDSRLPRQTRINPFGLIPKRQQPGKWRLIVNLSSPRGASVNDGISAELCSLKYTGLNEAVAMCQRLGPDCLLAKIDLKQIYRVVPIHPEDWHLLGMQWQGQVYLDTALPFGLRSAPKILSALANVLLRAMASKGVREGLHYLDDFCSGEGTHRRMPDSPSHRIGHLCGNKSPGSDAQAGRSQHFYWFLGNRNRIPREELAVISATLANANKN